MLISIFNKQKFIFPDGFYGAIRIDVDPPHFIVRFSVQGEFCSYQYPTMAQAEEKYDGVVKQGLIAGGKVETNDE